jgi:hypothetical protein
VYEKNKMLLKLGTKLKLIENKFVEEWCIQGNLSTKYDVSIKMNYSSNKMSDNVLKIFSIAT